MRSSVLGVQIGGGGGEPGRSEGRSFRRISATASSFHVLGMKRQAGCRGLGSRGDNARHAADLRFRRPPHRRRAPRSTSASTTTPRQMWTPPRSRQPEAPAPHCRRGELCIASHLIAARQHGGTPTPGGDSPPQPHTPPPKKPDTSRRRRPVRPLVRPHRATAFRIHRGATSDLDAAHRATGRRPLAAAIARTELGRQSGDWCRRKRRRVPRRRYWSLHQRILPFPASLAGSRLADGQPCGRTRRPGGWTVSQLPSGVDGISFTVHPWAA